MKKLILSITIGLLSIFNANAQDVVNLTDVYQDPSTQTIAQFVVDYEGVSAKEIKSSVEQWAASTFVDVREVEMANGEDYIVYKPLLTYNYWAMGMPIEGRVTPETKFQFKDGKMRVTIIEVDSRYVGDYGVSYSSTSDQFTTLRGKVDQIKAKGLQKQQYNRITAAIGESESWIETIKSIEIKSYEDSNNDW